MTELPDSATRAPESTRSRRGGPLAPSFTVARIRGIAVGLHWSWLLIFAYVTWALSSQLFPRTYPGLSSTVYWVMGSAAAIIFFTSILLHEFGHAFQALREGMRISDITLWFFGGIARFMGMFPSAGAEFRIAIAGPLVSIALAILFGALTWVSGALAVPEAVRGVLDYLARINAVVVAFNLIPALPLDGGRVLRAWLWSRQGDFTAATVSAAKAARAFAYALVAVGLLGFFTDATTGGLGFVFLGWFLLQAAQAEVGFAAAKQALEDVVVGDLMTRNPVTVPPEMSIEEFIETVVRRHGHSTYPVVRDGRLHGMISLRVAGAIPYVERSSRTVQQLMVPANEVPVLGPRQQVLDVLDALRSGPGRAMVVDFGQVVGLVSISDIAKALEFEKVRRPIRAQARPAGALVWVVVWLLIALALAAFLRPPLAVLAPGPAIDIADDISIKGVPTEKPNGRYLLVAVRISQPTGLGVLYAMFHPDRDIIPRSALIPEGVSEEEEGRRQRAIFDESQTLAAAAAAQAAGMEVKIAGRGARIIQIATGAPAQGKLSAGDVITRVNDVEIKLASDLRRTITSLPSGTNFVLTVDRGGREVQVQVASARLSGAGGQAAIGVIVDTRDLDIDLPFEVEFKERNIGGPSAGLAYSLVIADLINDEDLLRGRTIAASGTIQIDGEVGPVGGLNQKLEAAENAEAEVFLVPVEEVRLVQNPDLSVRGVDTLRDALAVLRGA